MAHDKKKSGMSLDTDSMIWRAMSLQRAAKELEKVQDNSKQDTLLFMGGFIAVPVLLTLATEIALKHGFTGKRRKSLIAAMTCWICTMIWGRSQENDSKQRCQRCHIHYLGSHLPIGEFERHCASIGRYLYAGGTRTRIRVTYFIFLSSTTYSLQ